MSTALGHGLVDPKRWGKPVSFANTVGRIPGLMGALGALPFLSFGEPLFPQKGGDADGGGEGGSDPLGGWGRKSIFIWIRRPMPHQKGIWLIFQNRVGGSSVAG